MTLSGLLSDYSLPDLLFYLGNHKRSGWLFLESRRATVCIALHMGRVVEVTSDDPRRRLGQRLIASGAITTKQLDDALASQTQFRECGSHKVLGELLIDAELVPDESVQDALREQMGELLFEVLIDPRGEFVFQKGMPPEPVVEIDSPLEAEVFTAIWRADEWIGNNLDRARFELEPDTTPEMIAPFIVEGWPVLEALLDGASTFQEVLVASDCSHEQVRNSLLRLQGSGVVHIVL
jgi:hypothetical protein